MSEILPNLFLGPLDLIHDAEFLDANGITHVVTVLEQDYTTKELVARHVSQMRIRLYDLETEDIYSAFEPATNFIHDALESGGAVYVHCFMGISRSPTIVAAYLLKYKGFKTVEETLAFLQKIRSCVSPNDGFVGALERWCGGGGADKSDGGS
jgi:protein-tyrosine phosphatase